MTQMDLRQPANLRQHAAPRVSVRLPDLNPLSEAIRMRRQRASISSRCVISREFICQRRPNSLTVNYKRRRTSRSGRDGNDPWGGH